MHRLIDRLDIQRGVKVTFAAIVHDTTINKDSLISIACVMNSGFRFYNDVLSELELQGYSNVECLFLTDLYDLPKPKANKLYIIDTLLDTGQTAAEIESSYVYLCPHLKLKFLFLCKKKYQQSAIASEVHCAFRTPIGDYRLYGYGLDDGVNIPVLYNAIFTNDDVHEI